MDAKGSGGGFFAPAYIPYMDDITFRSDIPITPLASCATDNDVIQAMFVSTDKLDEFDKLTREAIFGRINSLMKNRHGTPFEHTFFKVYSEAPLFVYREWHRHRIGISINEQSGRYSELPPMFYIPPPERDLMQKPGSKQMDYESVPGTPELYEWLIEDIKADCTDSYGRYQARLERGIVKEVARISLNLNIYSKMVWTCNARSLMAFLSLRTRRGALLTQDENDPVKFYRNEEGAMFPSKPQWEITKPAEALEDFFEAQMPLTHEAFENNGRVAP